MKNKEVIAQLLAIKKLGCLTDKDRQALALAIRVFEGRPEGKWIVSGYTDTCRGYVAKCPFCEEDTVGGGDFCKHCGADMRKGAEE